MAKVFMLFLAVLAFIAACGNEVRQQDRAARKAPGKQSAAVISRVVDGDTIHVTINGQDKTVRLIGIDTPETHKPGVKVECGGKEASANMARLAPVGAKATLTADPTQDKVDRYGRMLAYVRVNRRLLQREQVYDGWAEVYVYGGHAFQRADSFRAASDVAKRAHRGVWGACSGDFHSLQPGR
jgi:micrococcal nuclease